MPTPRAGGSGYGQDQIIVQQHALGVAGIALVTQFGGVQVVGLIFPGLTFIVTDHRQPAAVWVVAVVPNYHDRAVA